MDLFGHRLSTRSRFFHGLAAGLDAGLPVDQAVLTCVPEDRHWQSLGRSLAEEIRTGRTLSEGLERHDREHHLLPQQEVVMIEAGERSGRLPRTLKHLADYLEQAAQARRKLTSKLAYPVLLIHAAIFLPTLPIVVRSGFVEYLQTVVFLLVALYGVGFAIWIAAQRSAPAVRLRIPWLGKAIRAQATADFAFVLSSLVGSGTALPDALRTSAASLRPPFRAAAQSIALHIHRGGELHQAVQEHRELFGPIFAEQVKIGERSGRLEEMLASASKLAREELHRAVQAMTVALSAGAFAVAVGVIAWVVLSFWSGHARSLDIARVESSPTSVDSTNPVG